MTVGNTNEKRLTHQEFSGIAHVLSIAGNVLMRDPVFGETLVAAECWTAPLAHQHTIARFKKYHATETDLNTDSLLYEPDANTTTESEFFKKIAAMQDKSAGNPYSIVTGWERHAIGISFVKEDAQLHVIVSNKGERSSDKNHEDTFLKQGTQVYTLEHYFDTDTSLQQDDKHTLHKIFTTCSGKNSSVNDCDVKTSFNQLFTSQQIVNCRNDKLSDVMKQKIRAVSNCTVANQNMAWHIALAVQKMQETPKLSLQDAFLDTAQEYRAMRFKDRIDALVCLLEHQEDFAEGWDSMVTQALGIIVTKYSEYGDERYSIPSIVNEIRERSPTAAECLKRLMIKVTQPQLYLPSDEVLLHSQHKPCSQNFTQTYEKLSWYSEPFKTFNIMIMRMMTKHSFSLADPNGINKFLFTTEVSADKGSHIINRTSRPLPIERLSEEKKTRLNKLIQKSCSKRLEILNALGYNQPYQISVDDSDPGKKVIVDLEKCHVQFDSKEGGPPERVIITGKLADGREFSHHDSYQIYLEHCEKYKLKTPSEQVDVPPNTSRRGGP